MKTPLFLAALLLVPALSRAEEAPASPAASPPPAAALETPPAPPAPAPVTLPDGAFRHRLLVKFDTDKDGKLSEPERAALKTALKEKEGERRARVLEKFDADKDGKLNGAERGAAKAAFKARQEAKAAKGKGKTAGDEKGAEKAAARLQQLLEKFDENKDGQLSEAERAKAREARKTATSL